MAHPDEGTLHAWLDGALTPGESLVVESHITTCEACANAVAEARGYIAASSRILSALDHVPGGVVPSIAVTSSGLAEIRQAESRRKRQLRQVFAAAATMVLMVSGGMYVVSRTDLATPTTADTVALAERITDVAARDAASSRDSAAALPAVASQALPQAPQPTTPDVGATQSRSANATRSAGAQADVAATVAAVPAPRPTPPPTSAGTPGAAMPRTVASGDAAMRRVRTDSAVADSAAPARNAAERAQLEALPVAMASAPLVPAVTGCYQVISTTDLSVADSRRDEAIVVASLPSQLRLTDSLVFDQNGDRRFLARSVMPGGTPVRRFAWSLSPSGTLRLFVGDSVRAPAVNATLDSAATSRASARLQRVGCS